MRRGSRDAEWRRRIVAGVGVAALLAIPAAAEGANRGLELVTPSGSDPSSLQFDWADAGGGWVYTSSAGGLDPFGAIIDGAAPDAFAHRRTSSGWIGDWVTPYCLGDTSVRDGTSNCQETQANAQRGLPNGVQGGAGGQIIFTTLDPIDPADTNGNSAYDVYAGSPNGVTLLSRGDLPLGVDGASIVAGGDGRSVAFTDSTDMWFNRGGALHGPVPGTTSLAHGINQVSADGAQLVFRSSASLVGADGDAVDDIYAWDGTSFTLLTPGTTQSMNFRYATPDGDYVFFTTAESLEIEDGDAVVDVYRSSPSAPTPVLMSHGTAVALNGIAGALDDGSRVLFASNEALAGAPAGAMHLYANDSTQTTHLASMPTQDTTLRNGARPWATAGDVVILNTTGRLDAVADTNTQLDVYRWKVGTPGVQMVSPRPAGPQSGGVDFRPGHRYASARPRLGPGLSADGSRVFMQTPVALLPAEDTDTRIDVYEWTVDEGLSIATALGGNDDIYYAGNSADGTDLFLQTGASLNGWDRDGGELDVYDARIGGGFPDPPDEEGGVGSPPASGGGGSTLPDVSSPSTTQEHPVPPVPAVPPTNTPDDNGPEPTASEPASVVGRSVVVDGRRATVRLDLPSAGDVRVRLTTRHGKRVLARGGAAADAAGREVVRLRLTKRGRKALRDGRSVKAAITTVFVSEDGSRTKDRTRVVLRGDDEKRGGADA